MRHLIILIFLIGFLTSCSFPETGTQELKDTSKDSAVLESKKVQEPETETKPVKKALPPPDSSAIHFSSKKILHPRGDTFELSFPKGFDISIVAHGFKRPRFMAMSPDDRLFFCDMYSIDDNKKGKIVILENFDSESGTFTKKSDYLSNLRNPNSLQFHKDSNGKEWIYIALTEKLIRYPYTSSDLVPPDYFEILDTFPSYGLSYRYGGWHLTRTILFANNKLYVSVGSSCNSCIEKEEKRAVIIEMDPDGKNKRIFAQGLRNAVGLEKAEGNLYATNMAADHLGKNKPDDAMFRIIENGKYGWPFYYHWKGKVYTDPKYENIQNKPEISSIEVPFSSFGAHTAPLGISWFNESLANDNIIKNYFLVAQHGSYNPKIGRGYSIERIREGRPGEDFIYGFLDKNLKIHGRPCGILPIGNNSFYFTDDKFGTVYFVSKTKE